MDSLSTDKVTMAEGPSQKRHKDSEATGSSISSDEDTFRQMLAGYCNMDLYRVTRFYRPRIQAIVEDFAEEFAFKLKAEHIIREDEAEGINQLVRNGQAGDAAEFAVKTVMRRGERGGRAMWEMFVKLHPNKPKLEKILREIQQKGNALRNEAIWSDIESQVSDFLKSIQAQHKETLRVQTETMTVNIIRGRVKKTVSLSARYTELILISSPRDQSHVEHELVARGRAHEEWQRKHTRKELERIHISQLLRSSFCKNSLSGTSVVGGAAGIGKTTLLQKMVHDWATGKVYPQFHFVFFFKFRELNVITERINLRTLVLDSYPYLSKVIDELWKETGKLLFIFDGLDEFKDRIDFTENQRNTATQYQCCNPQFWCEVSDIVRCLIQGKVLPGCSVLITTRPTALESLLEAEMNVFAEIQGFLAEERKEYFQKFFEDEEVAAKAFAHVEENAILYTMSFNPSYCGILCSSLESFFTQKVGKQRPLPKTITQLYANHIYNILTNHGRDIENPREVLRKTGEMALRGLHRKTIIFKIDHLDYHHLQPCLFLSGFMMELLEKDSSTHNLVYTFHHLTIQEFVAALSHFLTPAATNLPTPNLTPFNVTPLLDFAHNDRDDRFQIFLRFLIGLSDPHSNSQLQEVLGAFPTETSHQVIDWLKRMFANMEKATNITGKVEMKRNLLNIFHYLFESQNTPLIKATLGSLKAIDFCKIRLSPVDCSVLVAGLEHCEMLEYINLNYCYIQSEGFQRLVSVIDKCEQLSLGYNNLGDSGVKLLCEALRNPECKIQTLELQGNKLTADCTEDLASALSTNCSLISLQLNYNKLGDFGVKRLCEALRNPECKIQTLWLTNNKLTADCTEDLASALTTNRSLTKLYLANNNLGDSGVKSLCEALRNPECKIQTLELNRNKLTADCTEDLASALTTNRSLTVLYLENNNLGDSGVKSLCEALRNPEYKIQILWLDRNSLTDGCTDDLVSALSTSRSLWQLGLGSNSFTDASVPALRRLTLTCTSLESIWLGGNQFSSDGQRQLRSLGASRAGLAVTVR